ncbi:hypothetical protein [Streptomyces sp. NPDC047042]|uniref:hypothetical protein n=1 Tax=Streptomyces sp. NPDC047042 TaxID=3154807 RepID=UPI0033EFCDE4
MNTKLVNSVAGVINAALTQNRTAAGIAMALESARLLQSPEAARRLAELEDLEQRLLAMLPTGPRQEYGLPNDLAASAAEWGAWQQVAEALGAGLPYEGQTARGLRAQTLHEHVIARDAEIERLKGLIEAARALHVKCDDSEHCEHDYERWPCPTLTALGDPGGAS